VPSCGSFGFGAEPSTFTSVYRSRIRDMVDSILWGR
jgi:hypothetical protein